MAKTFKQGIHPRRGRELETVVEHLEQDSPLGRLFKVPFLGGISKVLIMTYLSISANGVHDYRKALTSDKPLEKANEPEEVIIPLSQNIGAPSKPVVAAGDLVEVGQKIAEAAGFVSVPLHSSVSGEVKAIKEVELPGGGEGPAIIIQSDGRNTVHDSVQPRGSFAELTPAEIQEIIKEAGIVGMGGAMFPAHVKLSVPDGKKAEAVIINGAECEPYLTVDHRLMLEEAESIVFGLKALMKSVDVERGYIGIEDNKPDAIKNMQEAVKDEPGIEVIPLEAKYPQGAEKMLINAITGKEVPSGGLPLDVGVIVQNVGTAVAVTNAIRTGMPLIERGVTVTGPGISEPKNLLVKIGTPIKEVIEQAGGFKGKPGKVILGGPMMGMTQHSTEVSTLKGTSGILVILAEEVNQFEPSPCIKCARCVDACPLMLMPVDLARAAEYQQIDKLEELNALDCMECGSCSYVCPARRPLVQRIKLGKGMVMAERKKQKD
ncbi:MAG: electron transport complex subunit RsxC [Halanaerobium sp.]|nr:electron transport complex subunit RsxC [Halanaerobium sp.]